LKDATFKTVSADMFENAYQLFAEYIDWRADHPSDDLMTQLLNAEIEEDGVSRPLTRTEVLTYTSMIAGAGNETTTRLIGFIGQLLCEHPDQRRQLVDNFSLIPGQSKRYCGLRRPHRCRRAMSPTTPNAVTKRFRRFGYVAAQRFCQPRRAAILRWERFDIHRTGGHLSFGRACTSVSVRHWRGCRRGWRSRRSSSAGPNGRSITTRRRWRTPRAWRGWGKLPVTIG